MIYSVNGTVDLIEPNLAVIDCGGGCGLCLPHHSEYAVTA